MIYVGLGTSKTYLGSTSGYCGQCLFFTNLTWFEANQIAGRCFIKCHNSIITFIRRLIIIKEMALNNKKESAKVQYWLDPESMKESAEAYFDQQ